MRTIRTFGTIILLAALGGAGAVAAAAADRVTANFSDPSRPGTLRASLTQGSITVKGHAGREVIIEASTRDESSPRSGRSSAGSSGGTGGMVRVPVTATGLSIEEENNRMRIGTDAHSRTIDLVIQVPLKTSLTLRTANSGGIEVSGVEGELDVNALNGPVTLRQVGGTIVAHALNGKVLVTLTRIDAKPMAFSTLNGHVDVTFPAALRANIVMSSDNGDIYSDFELKTEPAAPQQVEDRRSQGGKFRVQIDKSVRASVGGGGPEIRFKTFNGNIYIRKGGQ